VVRIVNIVNQPEQESKTNTAASAAATSEPGAAEARKIPFWRVMISVIQASFGVQNQSNRERDFTQGRFLPFVIAALLFTVVFVVVLMLVVRAVLHHT
jgi:uncharacterized integral membrane protein